MRARDCTQDLSVSSGSMRCFQEPIFLRHGDRRPNAVSSYGEASPQHPWKVAWLPGEVCCRRGVDPQLAAISRAGERKAVGGSGADEADDVTQGLSGQRSEPIIGPHPRTHVHPQLCPIRLEPPQIEWYRSRVEARWP